MLETVVASLDQRHLVLNWQSGAQSHLPAEVLRREAQDAWSKRERIDHGEVKVAPGITITDINNMGYGINLQFSDGHDKAIYPEPFLRELCERFDK